jgi:hypothetical protein
MFVSLFGMLVAWSWRLGSGHIIWLAFKVPPLSHPQFCSLIFVLAVVFFC